MTLTPPQDLYLDLMKRVLTGLTQQDPPVATAWLGHSGYREADRIAGYDWPSRAHSMIGWARMTAIQDCAGRVLADGVPGDLLEAGVWRGGACIFMRAILKAHGVTDRCVWAADSFAGLPSDPGWPDADVLAVPEDEVRRNFSLYGLLDEQVQFLPGWFRETLPDAPVGQLAILRLDADLYESQLTVLNHLYPKLSSGGFVLIDDPQLDGCRKAVDEYRAAHGITAAVTQTGPYGIFWRKP